MPAKDTHHYSDEALIAAYRRSQDNMWLGRLLERYTLLLLGVAMKYLKDTTAAQDAVQQVFLKALTHFPEGEIQNFKGWLYILMRNYCFQQLRDKPYTAGEEALAGMTATDAPRNHYLEQEATLEQMNAALTELNEEQRNCVTRFYLQKESYAQIIAATGYSFAQVKSHIQNGKRNLRIILTRKQRTDRHI